MSGPRVAIIVLNWNGFDLTKACLEGLRAVATPHHVVLVDNGSRDDEAGRLEAAFPEATVLRNARNEGFAGGVNRGLRWALERDFEYVLLLNNDTEVEPGFLEPLLAAADADPRLGVASPTVLLGDGETVWAQGARLWWWAGIVRHQGKGRRLEAAGEAPPPGRIDFVPGCCYLIRRAVLEQVGLLEDGYFAYYEDVDHCLRARAAGWTVAVLPSAGVLHHKSASAGKVGSNRFTPRQAYLQGRNGVLLGRRCMKGRRRATWLFGQFTFRFAHIALMGTALTSAWYYALGLWDGLRSPLSGAWPPEARLARLGLA